MATADFTIADVLAWARTKPADERYYLGDASNCALGQFGEATNRHYLSQCYDPDRDLGFTCLNSALGFDTDCRLTFGGLADRLEALLPAKPISDTWVKADAYMPDGLDELIEEFALLPVQA